MASWYFIYLWLPYCKGEAVPLDGSNSTALAGTIVAWDWDLDNDGEFDDAFGEHVEHTWAENGEYPIGLRVTSSDSLTLTKEGTATVQIGYADRCNDPPVAKCKDIQVSLDVNGNVTILPTDIDNGSFDPDGDPITRSISDAEFNCSDIGVQHAVTLTVTDDSDESDSCVAMVTVVDNTAPTIDTNAPETITPSDAPISFAATATENCSAAVEITDYSCYGFTGSGKQHSKMQSCVVSVSGDTITITDSGGVGDNIVWTIVATDQSGNTTSTEGHVVVENPGDRGKKK
ncbi:MAG: hypothetical protein D3922_03435 [Candidatus Electrothrix sp. AR1]|nr:hypothetical protein [Candidatus Electrothrix sp. AR1]